MPSPKLHDRDRIKELLSKGCTRRQVCIRLGISDQGLRKILRQERAKEKSTA